MNKQRLIHQILAQLAEETRACLVAAKAAHAEATDEQNKAENKYDTRGLEASYLARGQALQIAEIDEARQLYDAFIVRDFAPAEAVSVGAIVQLQEVDEESWYFFGPAAGGAEVTIDGREVVVITSGSPLAKVLLGRRAGDTLSGNRRILSVA